MQENLELVESRILSKMSKIFDQNVAILSNLQKCKSTLSDMRERMSSIETKIQQNKTVEMHNVQLDKNELYKYNGFKDGSVYPPGFDRRQLFACAVCTPTLFDFQFPLDISSANIVTTTAATTVSSTQLLTTHANLNPALHILNTNENYLLIPQSGSSMGGNCKAVSSKQIIAPGATPVLYNQNQDFELGIKTKEIQNPFSQLNSNAVLENKVTDGKSLVYELDTIQMNAMNASNVCLRDMNAENDEFASRGNKNNYNWIHLDSRLTDYDDSEESSVSNLNSSSSDSISINSIDQDYSHCISERKLWDLANE